MQGALFHRKFIVLWSQLCLGKSSPLSQIFIAHIGVKVQLLRSYKRWSTFVCSNFPNEFDHKDFSPFLAKSQFIAARTMCCTNINARRDLSPTMDPTLLSHGHRQSATEQRLVRNSFQDLCWKTVHILPVLWKQDVSWRSRGYRCIFQHSKYSPPQSHCRGSWARDTYVAPSSARERFILRCRHEQRGIWGERRNPRHCPHSRAIEQCTESPPTPPALPLPAQNCFQIQTAELNLPLRETWHLKGGYTVC